MAEESTPTSVIAQAISSLGLWQRWYAVFTAMTAWILYLRYGGLPVAPVVGGATAPPAEDVVWDMIAYLSSGGWCCATAAVPVLIALERGLMFIAASLAKDEQRPPHRPADEPGPPTEGTIGT